jgi:hypothetical protein
MHIPAFPLRGVRTVIGMRATVRGFEMGLVQRQSGLVGA